MYISADREFSGQGAFARSLAASRIGARHVLTTFQIY